MKNKIFPQKRILKNGLRVISVSLPHLHSIASFCFIGIGSRYENKRNNGISHFLEHLLFKGTEKYSTQQEVAEAIEGIGGQLNGWTNQDHTAYWTMVPKKYLQASLEILSQLVFAPKLLDDFIDDERPVILEEINRHFDNPESLVWDKILETLWSNHPLGYPVIGSKQVISKLKRSDFLSHLRSFYQPKNMVLAIAGSFNPKSLFPKIEKFFGQFPSKKTSSPLTFSNPSSFPKVTTFFKKTDQAHIVIGWPGISLGHPDRFILTLLNCLLGQGMSSRLFLSIREKGLAYHISSSTEFYTDTGGVFIQAGLSLAKIDFAIKSILEEVNKIINYKVGRKELKKGKEYLIGGLELLADGTGALADWFGRQELLAPQTFIPAQVIELIGKVNQEDIIRLANKIFRPQNLSLAIVGPFKDKEKFEKIIKI